MTGRKSTHATRDPRRAVACVGIVCLLISASIASPAAGLDTLYPTKDGTIADGQFPEPFDGTPDAYQWYFYDSAAFAGMITRGFTAPPSPEPNLERRLFWEYDLSSVATAPPVSATLTFKLVSRAVWPTYVTDVHVYAYAVTLPLAENMPGDYLSDPSDLLQGVAAVPQYDWTPGAASPQTTTFDMDVSEVVNNALASGGSLKAVAFRFQIDPNAPSESLETRIDARDNDPTTKPRLTIDIAPVELPGDIDSNQVVDLTDLEIFVDLLLGPPHSDGYPAEYWTRADMNADGPVDGLDIQLFVDAMTAP